MAKTYKNNLESCYRVFSREIDFGHLRIKLLMLPDAINTAIAGTTIHVRTIADTLNQNKIVKSMLGEVDKLL